MKTEILKKEKYIKPLLIVLFGFCSFCAFAGPEKRNADSPLSDGFSAHDSSAGFIAAESNSFDFSDIAYDSGAGFIAAAVTKTENQAPAVMLYGENHRSQTDNFIRENAIDLANQGMFYLALEGRPYKPAQSSQTVYGIEDTLPHIAAISVKSHVMLYRSVNNLYKVYDLAQEDKKDLIIIVGLYHIEGLKNLLESSNEEIEAQVLDMSGMLSIFKSRF